MEPKDKAKELVSKYIKQFSSYEKYLSNMKAKQCALIVVDEIIMEREVIYASLGIPSGTFWKEVKVEIEAL